MLLEIHQLAKEEVYRGWVRIPEYYRKDLSGRLIPEASVAQIISNDRKLLAIMRGDKESDSPTIKLDEISRRALGIGDDKIGKTFDLLLYKASVQKQICFFWSHPEPSSRFAMRLAMLSPFLGLCGVATGIISLALYLIK